MRVVKWNWPNVFQTDFEYRTHKGLPEVACSMSGRTLPCGRRKWRTHSHNRTLLSYPADAHILPQRASIATLLPSEMKVDRWIQSCPMPLPCPNIGSLHTESQLATSRLTWVTARLYGATWQLNFGRGSWQVPCLAHLVFSGAFPTGQVAGVTYVCRWHTSNTEINCFMMSQNNVPFPTIAYLDSSCI